ncbi:MAG: DUF2254 domain-containing protein [Armatimonadetes bacterium]|nr:DUF2254 domain-containing protein [Armatimonadota bacterium]
METHNEPRASYRSYVLLAVAWLAVLLLLTWFELRRLAPHEDLGFLLAPSNQEADRMLRHLTRTTIQLISLFTTVTAIAVPLTANLYTPRLIDMFVRDRINRGFFTLLIFSSVTVHYTLYVMRERADFAFNPLLLINLAAGLGFLCMFLAGPYLYYMFNFLRPPGIVRRMQRAVMWRLAAERRGSSRRRRAIIADVVEQLGEVALRAGGRNDVAMAANVIEDLGEVASRYRGLKSQLPPEWFEGDPSPELSMTAAALNQLGRECCWFEFHLLRTIDGFLPALVNNTPEAVAYVGRVTRQIVSDAHAAGDQSVVRMGLKFFNTYLRRTLLARPPRALLFASDELRQLGNALLDSTEPWTLSIADSLAYYAAEAETGGALAARDLLLYDLGELVVTAMLVDSARATLYRDVLYRAYEETNGRLEPLIKAIAQTIGQDRAELVQPLARLLDRRDAAEVRRAVETVLGAVSGEYREMTGRVVDLNHVEADRREALRVWWESRLADSMSERLAPSAPAPAIP